MRICWNELPQLQNIMSHIKPEKEDDFRLSQDYYDLKETIWIFVDDYIKNNITIYKDKHFDDIITSG